MMDIDTQNSQMTLGTKNGVNSGPLRVKTTLELGCGVGSAGDS